MKKTLSLALALLLLSSLGLAWFRESADYRANPDAIAGGGGPATSLSYAAPQQALGQIAGFAASPSYRNRAGVVQAVIAPKAPPSVWEVF